MRPLTLRRLTPGEHALGAEVFGAALDTARVRIFAAPVWDRAFVPGGGLMIWPAVSARADFADPATPLALQATFVHELVHVWQAQNGVFLPLAKIKAGDGEAAYAYDLELGTGFPDMNIEQQAMVVEDAFRQSRGGQAPHPQALYTAASAHWRGA